MHQSALPFSRPPSYDTDAFVPSTPNKLAYDWICKWPDWPTGMIIHGPSHCGKTHLGHIWMHKSHAQKIYVDTITLENIAPVFDESTHLLLENFAIINDGQAEALFHLFNHQKKTGKSILILSHTCPQNWSTRLPDLTSRLSTLNIAEIMPPDDILLQSILIKRFSDLQLSITPQVLIYLLARIERTYESLDYWVTEIDKASLSHGRQISIPLIKKIDETPPTMKEEK